VSALALPGEDRPAGSRVGRLILEESAALTTAGLVEALKHASGRTRPNGESDLSFPSGHAAASSSFATMTIANLCQSGLSPPSRRVLATGVGALAVGTSWARIEAGEHYPSDVLAGAALGHFVSVVIHDAWLGSSEPPMVQLELGPSRRAIGLRMGF
jgi:membrane-associated phospholipid phosphatase